MAFDKTKGPKGEFVQKPEASQSKSKRTGGQGNGGAVSGGKIMGVNNPRGTTAKKIKGGNFRLVQPQREGKVGL